MVHLSAKVGSGKKDSGRLGGWEVERLGGWEVGRLLTFLAPPDFSMLVFCCNSTFFIGTTQAGGPGRGRWFQSTVP